MKTSTPAFPRAITALPSGHTANGEEGMTLQDWFAGMALAAIIQTGIEGTVETAAKRLGIKKEDYKPSVHYPQLCAMEAYEMATAMILEKSK